MNQSEHVNFKTPNSWELGGESVIHCETIPNPPTPDQNTRVRLTHSNSYGPVDDVKFFIRIGDLKNPTYDDQIDSVSDWIEMDLGAESVWVDGEERTRSEALPHMDSDEGNVWAGTFEATLIFPAGKQRIEIRVLSTGLLGSGVISDWRVKVQ